MIISVSSLSPISAFVIQSMIFAFVNDFETNIITDRLFMYLVETYFRTLVSRLEFITQCYDNKSLNDCISAIICLTVSNYSRVPNAFTTIIFN